MSILLLMGVAAVLTWLQAHQTETHRRAMTDEKEELSKVRSSAAHHDAYLGSPLHKTNERWLETSIIGAPALWNSVWLWYCGIALFCEAAVTVSWNGEPLLGCMLSANALSNIISVGYTIFVAFLIVMVVWIDRNAKDQKGQLAEIKRDVKYARKWIKHWNAESKANAI